MASLKFIVAKSDGGIIEKTAQMNDADVGRLMAWALATLPDQYDESSPPQPVERTVDWAVGRLLEGYVAEKLALVYAFYQARAAAQAVASIQPISVSMA